MLGPRKRPTSYHSRAERAPERRQPDAGVQAPQRPPQRRVRAGRTRAQAIRPPGLTTRASSREGRRRVVDVAKQVGEGQVVELAVRRTAGAPPRPGRARSAPRARVAAASARRAPREHRRGSGRGRRPCTRSAARAPRATRPVPVATSRTRSSGAGVDRADHRAPPARVLPEAERAPRAGRSGARVPRTAPARRACAQRPTPSAWPMVRCEAFQKRPPRGSRRVRECLESSETSKNEEMAMATEEQTDAAGRRRVATAGQNTLTITDNRTGRDLRARDHRRDDPRRWTCARSRSPRTTSA